MKESNFIKKNLDSWGEYEKIISLKEDKPRILSKLFMKINDDLSYSYTYYNNRLVRVYLNGVAKLLYNRVNQSERIRFSSLKKFFTVSVPLAIYQARKEFYIAFAVFAVSMIIGMLSSKYDPEFAQLILGEDYVKMTQANIAKNDPMAVYKSQAPFDMFLAITVNNFLVAIRTFVFGFFMAIGTILSMLYNGIMLGSFQYFFIEQDLFKESFLTIWQHGVFEISSIIMAGAAGLVLGKGLVFPGNYTRFQSLRISARRGLKLLLGILPVLFIAAFIEGFYTRYTGALDSVRIFTIIISFSFVIGYFIVLPWYRSKQMESTIDEIDEKIEETGSFNLETDRIYNGNELFMFTFQLFKANFWRILKWVLITALLFPLVLFLLNNLEIIDTFKGAPVFRPIESLRNNWISLLILIFSFCLLTLFLSKINIKEPFTSSKDNLSAILLFFQIIPVIGIIHASLFIPSYFFAVLFYTFCLMHTILIVNIINIEKINFLKAVRCSLIYLRGNYLKLLYLSVRFTVLGVLFFIIFMRLIAALNNELIRMNLYGSTHNSALILYYMNCFYFSVVILLAYCVNYLGIYILYFSLYESIHAKGLLSKINTIGRTRRLKGLIRE